METTEFAEIFARIKTLLLPYSRKMEMRANTFGNFHLYIIKNFELAGRKFKECYFSGVTIHKTMVSFYFFPLYTHPGELVIPPPIKKQLKGKNCFNFTRLNEEQESAITVLLKQGLDLYSKKFF
jgi:hypothetical protein